MMKRRDFLKMSTGSVISAGLLGSMGIQAQEKKRRWYKGNLHAHSQWSDGKDLPEIVVDSYKNKGYDFFCLSDHNVLQKEQLRFTGFAMDFTPKDMTPFEGETSFWKKMSPKDGWPNLIEEHLQKARDSVIKKETAEGTYVRMKTFDELKAQFAEEGRFLLIPGFEMTAPFVHVNLINVQKEFYMDGPDMSALVSQLFDKASEIYSDQGAPYLFTVNHPLWQYYNIQPSALIGRPEIRHVELNNNSTSHPIIPEAWTPETFVDIVNAYRAAHEQPVLYVTGTDDSHGVFRKDYLPFLGWMYVRADELTAEAIFEAMNRGDSYTSSGLELADVHFDGRTLEVKINPDKEGDYRIEFIGTKKDYDSSCKILDVPANNSQPGRVVEAYSDKIGQTLATVEGLEGSYTLQADDLYVRAKAYRIGAGNVAIGSDYPDAPLTADSAWTQVYRRGEI